MFKPASSMPRSTIFPSYSPLGVNQARMCLYSLPLTMNFYFEFFDNNTWFAYHYQHSPDEKYPVVMKKWYPLGNASEEDRKTDIDSLRSENKQLNSICGESVKFISCSTEEFEDFAMRLITLVAKREASTLDKSIPALSQLKNTFIKFTSEDMNTAFDEFLNDTQQKLYTVWEV